jgi:uncharacterized membrane protein
MSISVGPPTGGQTPNQPQQNTQSPSYQSYAGSSYGYQPQQFETTPISQSWQKQPWFAKYWRPAAAIIYLVICLADFIVFPVLWSLVQHKDGIPLTQWYPMTLQGGGLIHIAFGAILGISAYGRTKEKLSGI